MYIMRIRENALQMLDSKEVVCIGQGSVNLETLEYLPGVLN